MFSKTVQARSSVLYCGTTPIQRRARAGALTTSIPAIRTCARGRQGARRADADRRRLARAVRPQQAIDLALTHAEVDAVDGDHPLLALVDLSQAFDLNNHGKTLRYATLQVT